MKPNAQYSHMSAQGLAATLVLRARRNMYEHFIRTISPAERETVLDVGATSERTYEWSNYLEAWYPHKRQLTACGVDDASFLETAYPGLRFVRGDGLALPFADGAFDVVHSSAVIEHVGNESNQRRFLGEMARVARRAFFITTPNRWYPVEFHTMLPLIHWLPKAMHRSLLASLGHADLATEANLNLLDARQVREHARHLPAFRVSVHYERLFGWPSNLLIIGVREPQARLHP
jgi:hypothetical protein